MNKFLLSLSVCVLLVTGFTSATVQLDFFDVEVQETTFRVTWQMRVEQDVRTYELFRKTSYSDAYTRIGDVTAHGANRLYEYLDDQVYKSAADQVEYKLEVIANDGTREILFVKSVTYTPTYVRRTWGSIKAMFQ